jgi:hypothetical protein
VLLSRQIPFYKLHCRFIYEDALALVFTRNAAGSSGRQ